VPILFSTVTDRYASDPTCFVQGLLERSPKSIIQCCGIYGQSRVQELNLVTGKVRIIFKPSAEYFIEGCAYQTPTKLIVLTWREKVAFLIDLNSDSLIQTLAYPFDGWGLAGDGSRLWATNGTASLMTLDPTDLSVRSSCKVVYQGSPVNYLNALSYSEGKIFANIYMNILPPDYPYYILTIDSVSCAVLSLIPVFGIFKPSRAGSVFNGVIAGDSGLIVTGKQWPFLYRLKLGSGGASETWKKYPLERFITGPDPLK